MEEKSKEERKVVERIVDRLLNNIKTNELKSYDCNVYHWSWYNYKSKC